MKAPVHEEFEEIYCSEICKNFALLCSSTPESQLIAQANTSIIELPPTFNIQDFGLNSGYCLIQIPKSHQCLLHINGRNGKTFILVAAPSQTEELYVITITHLDNAQGSQTCEQSTHLYEKKQLFQAVTVTRQMDQLKVGEYLAPHHTYSSTKAQLQHELNEHLFEGLYRRGFESLGSLLQWTEQSRYIYFIFHI